MANDSHSTMKAILITGLVALLGTVAGGVIKGYWDVELAQQKLYSNLIMKAMESNSPKERLASLEFMVKTNLIKDTDIEEGLKSIVTEIKKDTTQTVPQFRPTRSVLPDSSVLEILLGKLLFQVSGG